MGSEFTSPLHRRWDARLTTWAEYVLSAEKGGRVKISSAYKLGRGGGGGEPEDGIPIHVGEAIDTHALYVKLPEHLRRAVWAWYCDQGTIGEKAAALAIHRDTLTDRVRLSRIKLEDMHQQRRGSKSPRTFPQNV